MNRWMMTCLMILCLGALPGWTRAQAAERQTVSVPAWSQFDGTRWGDLVLGEMTRGAFEAKYSSSRTDHNEVLQAASPKRAQTQMFLIFNGPGPEARLTWIVCFYEDPRSAPEPSDLVGRANWQEYEGYSLTHRAGWRIFAAPEQGLAVIAELRKVSYVVAALIMGDPQRVTGVAGRLQPAPPVGSPLTPEDARNPLRAPIGQPEVDVRVAPTLPIDGARLRSELVQVTDHKVSDWPVFQVTEGSQGCLSVVLDVEPRQPGDSTQLTLTARVSLDTQSDGLAIHMRAPDNAKTMEAAGSEGRIQEEARRLVERGIDAVAGAAQQQLERYQSQMTSQAQQEVRPALLEFLVEAAR